MKLKAKSDLHLFRKIWHCVSGAVVALSYLFFVTRRTLLIALAAVSAFYLFLEFLRLYHPKAHLWVIAHSPFRWGMRNTELSGVNTGLYYAASIFVSILIFPKWIAVLSILYLACGDPIASFVGLTCGKPQVRIFPGKSWSGIFAAFMTCGLITFCVVQGLAPLKITLLFSFAGALVGSLAEALPIPVDDNLSIPLLSGFGLWGIAYCFEAHYLSAQ